MRLSNPLIWALVLVGFVIGMGLGVYVAYAPTAPYLYNPDDGVACTQEAKICADGSAVSRSGQRCEFTACPAE